jgi:hypothetical protein
VNQVLQNVPLTKPRLGEDLSSTWTALKNKNNKKRNFILVGKGKKFCPLPLL